MSDNQIEAPKVTKPIQLLAAWLIGLIAINGSFLGAATQISKPEWAAGVLTIAAVINVPGFLLCLFLLQTRFRPEMQEDKYYAKYLEKRWSTETGTSEVVEVKVIESALGRKDAKPEFVALPGDNRIPTFHSDATTFINDLLPEYTKIVLDLNRIGINIKSTFGTNSKVPVEPSPFIISFGRDCDIDTLKAIVRVCLKYGLLGIGEAIDSGPPINIYIGSYSYKSGHPYLILTEELIAVLNQPEMTASQFAKITATGNRPHTHPS